MLLRSLLPFFIGLVCAGLWIAPQQVHAQNKYTGLIEKVDYTATTPTNVATLLDILQKQTGYSFTLERPALIGIVLPGISLHHTTLGAALQFLEEQAGLSFLISNRNIAVTTATPGFKKKSTDVQKSISLRGRVVDFETTDPDGKPATIPEHLKKGSSV